MAWIETLHWKVGPHQKKATVGNLLADDGAYSFEHKDPTVLSRMITEKNNLLENCMNNNRLVINPDKTHMMVMGNKNVEPLRQQIIMMAGNFITHPTKTETFLGGQVHQSLRWNQHLPDGKTSLVKQLTGRINGLK